MSHGDSISHPWSQGITSSRFITEILLSPDLVELKGITETFSTEAILLRVTRFNRGNDGDGATADFGVIAFTPPIICVV